MTARDYRFREIDIFRAIAILMVIGFHYFSRWTPPRHDMNYYPYGSYFSEVLLLQHGNLGVQFFFIISGFVIALTLESCKSLSDFALRRAARLVPAMVVCSLITFFVERWLLPIEEFRTLGSPLNLLPSWTFTDPYLWSKLLPITNWAHIDGAYWSLAIEVKFYFWAGVLYFLFRDRFLPSILALCAVTWLLYATGTVLNNSTMLKAEMLLLGSYAPPFAVGSYAPLFAAGIVFYRMVKAPHHFKALLPIVATCYAAELTSVAIVAKSMSQALGADFIITAFFGAFLLIAAGWRAPQSRLLDGLSYIGVVSYPLYLLHQNIGVGLLSYGIGVDDPELIIALVASIIVAMLLASMLIYHHVERPAKRLLLSSHRTWFNVRRDRA